MAAVYGNMKQYASHCATAAAGTSSAPCYAIADTVLAAVSVFLAAVRLLIVP